MEKNIKTQEAITRAESLIKQALAIKDIDVYSNFSISQDIKLAVGLAMQGDCEFLIIMLKDVKRAFRNEYGVPEMISESIENLQRLN